MILSLLILSRQANAEELSIAEPGPDGNVYQLINCNTEEDGNSYKCPRKGNILWTEAHDKAAGLTYKEFTNCHLATAADEKVNNFLKDWENFEDACFNPQDPANFLLCPWIGARDLTDGGNGTYYWLDDHNSIPCPYDSQFENCNPKVLPGVGTALTFEDWCRQENNCEYDEPNFSGEQFVGYIKYTTSGTIGWHDYINGDRGSGGPTSYFVECEVPPPACPERPGCFCASTNHTREVDCNTSAPWSDTTWKDQCSRNHEIAKIIWEQPSNDECQDPQ